MRLSSRKVAGMFVQLASASEMPLNSIKLHKVMYFAHGHALSWRGEGLIREPALAHRFGALYLRVFDSLALFGADDLVGLRKHGARKALRALGHDPCSYCEDVPAAEREIVEAVWRYYGPLSDRRVSEMFHVAGTPWEAIRQRYPDRDDMVIPDELTQDYFLGLKNRTKPRVAECLP